MAAGDKKTVVMKVCGKVPDSSGNVTPTAADVGAAPDGFGLGADSLPRLNYEQLGNWTKAGFAMFYDAENPIEGLSAGLILSLGKDTGITRLVTQIFYSNAPGAGQVTLIRTGSAYPDYATWQPWEWVNPPMMLGVEYRTMEQWNGTTVYAKLVSCGKGPSENSETLTKYGDGEDCYGLVSFCAFARIVIPDTGNLSTIIGIPYHDSSGGVDRSVSACILNQYIRVTAKNLDASNRDVYALMKYIKKTD